MAKQTTKITNVVVDKNVIKNVSTSSGQTLTPKQAATKIDKGEKMTYKGNEVQSLDGKFIRSKPDGKKGNNLKTD